MDESKTKGIYILGVGAVTEGMIELLEALNQPIGGLYHYQEGRTGEKVFGYSIVGSNAQLFAKKDLSGYQFALSMGDNDIRIDLSDQIRCLGGRIPTLIHPTALVYGHAHLEEGVVVQAHSLIGPSATVGRDVSIDVNAVISHHSSIESGCFIGPMSFIGAHTTLRQRVLVGASSTVVGKEGLIVGEGAVIGAGAVVTKSVPAGVTVVGNAARPMGT